MSRETEQVPASVREEVYLRDHGCCRVCGRNATPRGLHHIDYLSQGGLHVVENLVTIGWAYDHECHLSVVHRNKRFWQPVLQEVVQHDGMNARQLARWMVSAQRKTGYPARHGHFEPAGAGLPDRLA